MWPFSARKSRVDEDEVVSIQTKDFDFASFATNDTYMKLWLSEKLTASLDMLSVQQKVSRPDVLRWILFEHVYGRELFLGLVKYKDSLEHTPLSDLRFSRKQSEPESERAVNLQFLGKATENIKLWLPMPLKVELINLAEQHKQPLSNYVRSILVAQLFGQRFYRQWQSALVAINLEAETKESED
jgi:hypothetical protein